MSVLDNLKEELINQTICRVDFRKDKSLFIGLGDKNIKKKKSCVSFYGTWEIGTYNASWRIIKDGKIFIASESENLAAEAREIISLPPYKLIGIYEPSVFDLRFIFSDNLIIDFFNSYSEDDEFVHILKIDKTWWEKDNNGIWHKGKDYY
ncbi:MAG: hypothetical protein MJ159_03775 [Treponemataceae bacterium]|nr:hypothetical protein [Treponemataceae bacterium]